MRKAGLTGVVLVLTLTLVAFWWWQTSANECCGC